VDKDLYRSRPFNHTGFSAYLAEHKLMGTRCRQCGRILLPPRELCTGCYATQMEWIEFSGTGVLEGFTSIYVGLPAMAAAGYSREKPYCTGVIRLVEGPAISGQIIGDHGTCPEELAVGTLLQAVYIQRGPDQPVTLAFAKKVEP
jgi:uncharacterized protein